MATPAPKQVAPIQQHKSGRMNLGALVKGKLEQPMRIILKGTEGVGKSTFAADAPSPIFLGAEDGTSQLDVVRFPSPENWAEVIEAVRVLTDDDHEYKTFVLDTLDWAEPMLWAHICARDNQETIEAYGYGKGYQAALDEWRVFLAALERMRKAKGMHIILIAHSWIKPFKNPEGEDFDRYELKLNPKAGGLLKEWADCVLFANYETFATEDKKTKRIKGVSTGARLIYTQRTAAYDAKNRYSLPESLPLSWEEFATAVRAHSPADPAVLVSEIQRKSKLLGDKLEKQATAAIARAKGDAVKLAQLNDWANGKLAEKEAAQQ